MCTECQGLEDKLIFYDDAWMVVDCFPDAEDGCYNGHFVYLESQGVGDEDGVVCPYFDQAMLNPWKYCDGDLGAQGVCEHYSEDDTVRWICTELN